MMTGATGKIGNVVYYQKNGKTVARQMSSAAYNSKTVQQILQRIIIKTVAANYSRMKDIASGKKSKKVKAGVLGRRQRQEHYYKNVYVALFSEENA